MALFTSKKKSAPEDKAPSKPTGDSAPETGRGTDGMLSSVLIKPRITEKGGILAEHDGYAFDVAPGATKIQIKRAIEAAYKVSPVSVNIISVPAKRVIIRGKRGVRKGGKKAYVFLKKGDAITV